MHAMCTQKPKAEPQKKKAPTRRRLVIQESDEEEEEPPVEVKQPVQEVVNPRDFFASSKAKKNTTSVADATAAEPARSSTATQAKAVVKEESGKGKKDESAKAKLDDGSKGKKDDSAKDKKDDSAKGKKDGAKGKKDDSAKDKGNDIVKGKKDDSAKDKRDDITKGKKDDNAKGKKDGAKGKKDESAKATSSVKESTSHSTPAKRAKKADEDEAFEDDSDAEVIPQPKLRTAPAKARSPASVSKSSTSKKRRGVGDDDDEDDDAYKDEDEVVNPTKRHKPNAKKVKDDDAMDIDDAVQEEKPKAKSNFWAYKNKAGPSALGSKEIPKGQDNCLAGWTFVFTGELSSVTREDATDLVKRYSGRVTGTPSGKTSYMVMGDDAGQSKQDKAKKLKIKTLDEDQFLELIRTSPAKTQDGKIVKASSKSSSRGGDSSTSKAKANAAETPKAPSESSSPPACNESSKATPQETSKPVPKPLDDDRPVQTELWTTKYRPAQVVDLCGNKAQIQKLAKWLENWDANYQLNFKEDNTDKSGLYRAVLISGPPGIGKTSAAHLVGESLGYNIVEFNASDTRSKKSLDSDVRDLLDNQSLAGYFLGENKVDGKGKAAATETDPSMAKKQLIIMDEVDGMAGGDRGGVAQLISFIKKTHVPIICICNDRQSPKVRSLVNSCFDLRFQRPQVNQVRARLMSILFKENRTIPANVLDKLVSGSQSDIRQVLNMLSAWSLTKQTMDYDEGKALSKASEKYVALNPFQITEQLLIETNYRALSFADKFDLYFNDYQLAPLMVQENYVRMNPTDARGDRNGLEAIELMSKAADSLSDADLVDTMIHGSAQHWSLMPVHAAFSCVRPSFFVHGSMRPGSGAYGPMMQFPGYLGQNSKASKYNRLVKDIQIRMRLKISGDKNEVRQNYLPAIFPVLTQPLLEHGANAIPDLIDFMDGYYLNREDWDTILELGIGKNDGKKVMENIPTATKAAFTRKYNSVNHPQPFLKVMVVTKGRSAAGGGANEEVPDNLDVVEPDVAVPEEVDEAAEQQEEESIEKDNNIKQRTKSGGSASKGGSKSKSKGKGKAARK
ncbi:hypothetical protein BGZ65_008089 [Modicella reniformis]|uniref:Replication factor C subunit 1 n=1 Tax=Modicella reniformis TaxID=1440133 RepID=A0A9P6MB07_9FUNG|nr:hypothetical protein BGZ65_008089 [Modicella reniformis]